MQLNRLREGFRVFTDDLHVQHRHLRNPASLLPNAALLPSVLSRPSLDRTYIDGIAFTKVNFQFRQVGHVVENGQSGIAEIENFLCRQFAGLAGERSR
jgi:hypothetical protein